MGEKLRLVKVGAYTIMAIIVAVLLFASVITELITFLTVLFLPPFLVAMVMLVFRVLKIEKFRRLLMRVLLLMLLVNIWLWGIAFSISCGFIGSFLQFKDMPSAKQMEWFPFEESLALYVEENWNVPAWIGVPLYYIGVWMPLILLFPTSIIIITSVSNCKPRKCEVQQQ